MHKLDSLYKIYDPINSSEVILGNKGERIISPSSTEYLSSIGVWLMHMHKLDMLY